MKLYSGIRFPILASPVRLAVLALLRAAAVAALAAGWRVRHDVALALVAIQDTSAGVPESTASRRASGRESENAARTRAK